MDDVVKLKSARSSPAGGPWESLRHNRPYWFLIASDLISQSGDHFRLITVTVFTFQLSGSILATALQLVFASLPGFLFSHVAGRLADRYPVRTSLVVLSIISAIGTLFYIIAPNALAIFALNFCMATLRVTAGPIRGAWLPQIVKNEQVSAANGIRASAGGIVDLLFPILAGIVVAAFGTKAGFLVDSLSFLLAAIGFLMVSAPRATSISSQPSTGSETPDLGDANDPEARPIIVPTSGWEFVISHRTLLALLVPYVILAGAGQGLSAIFLPFLELTKATGATGFGVVISAYLLGNIVSGAAVARWGNKIPLAIGAALFSLAPLAWIGMSLASSYWLVLIFVLLDGCVSTGAVTLVHSIFQTVAPPNMVGRVYSVAPTWHFGAEVVGALAGAALAVAVGFTLTFQILAVASLVAITFSALLLHRIAQRPRNSSGISSTRA